jgi:hypothetical protein
LMGDFLNKILRMASEAFLAWQDKSNTNGYQSCSLSGHEARRHQLRDLCALRQSG